MKILILPCFLLLINLSKQDPSFDCSSFRNKLDAEGNILFIAGDRSYIVPKTIQEITPYYCDKHLASLENIRQLARNCMKPFPRQIIGLATYGARQEVKSLCKGPVEGKQEFLANTICFRDNTKINRMHDAMDKLILEFEVIRDNVHNESLKIPHICCSYFKFLEVSITMIFISLLISFTGLEK